MENAEIKKDSTEYINHCMESFLGLSKERQEDLRKQFKSVDHRKKYFYQFVAENIPVSFDSKMK